LDAGIVLICAFLAARSKRIYNLAIAILVLNIIITFFEEIGVIDALYMLLNGVILFILLVYRRSFCVAVKQKE